LKFTIKRQIKSAFVNLYHNYQMFILALILSFKHIENITLNYNVKRSVIP